MIKKLPRLLIFLSILITPPAWAMKATPQKKIEDEAMQALLSMSNYLKSSKNFSFEADVLYDDVLPSGQKILVSSHNFVSLRRPENLFVEHASDAGKRKLWFDGKSITLFDPENGTYGSDTFSGNTDKALNHLMNVLRFTPPLADFLYENPAAALTKTTLHGFVVGKTQIDGKPCLHLAFVDPFVDWQIWIEERPIPLPIRLVITYKTIQSAPQYLAHFTRWDFSRLPDSLFLAKIPQGSIQIPFLKTQQTVKK